MSIIAIHDLNFHHSVFIKRSLLKIKVFAVILPSLQMTCLIIEVYQWFAYHEHDVFYVWALKKHN